jgi:hypothetical protein
MGERRVGINAMGRIRALLILRGSTLILSKPAPDPSRLAALAPQDEEGDPRRRTLAPLDEEAGAPKDASHLRMRIR